MKILIFNWRDITHPEAGGAERYIQEIAERWVKQGHQATLFCGRYKNCKTYDEIDGIEITRKGGKYSVYIRAVWEYLTKLRKRNFDIVIDSINGVPFFTPLYIRKPKIAIIYQLTKDIFFDELPFYLGLVAYMAELLIPKFYRKISFVTISNSSKKEIVEVGVPDEDIKIIYSGVSDRYKPSGQTESLYPNILYLGRLRKYKQVDHLIRAMKIIKEKIKDAKLSIAGRGEMENELKRLTGELGLKDTVKFYGYVSETEKIILFQNTRVFVTPSKKEGWGLTAIEANACGTPSIAYNVRGLNEAIKNNETGLLVKNGNIDALSKAIIKVLRDKKRRENLIKNALEWSIQFSWDKSAEEFMKVLEGAVNGK